MIFSNIQSRDDLSKYPEAIAKAIRYAAQTNFDALEDGNHEIDGDRMFAKLVHLTSKPVEETHPELHKKYIDVQFWLGGEELFGIAPADGVGSLVGEDEKEDVYFYDSVAGESFMHAWKGCYAVFFPNDAHRPGVIAGDKPMSYRKVVVKVSVDLL